MKIRFREKERRNYFSCILYLIKILMDSLNYSSQDVLIIKHTLSVSPLKICKRVTHSIQVKGMEVATPVSHLQ